MVVKLIPLLLVVSFFALTTGCEKVFDEERSLLIETDRLLYSLGDTMAVRVHNPGEQAVYVRRCGPRSFRFALIQLDESTNTEVEIVPDVCRSFNQLRVGIMPRTEEELRIPLEFDLPRGVQLDGLYQIKLYLIGTLPVEPDTTLPNRSNTFVLTTGSEP
ncbi:MAG: hypothetical protein JJU41_06305 [Bacteroidetes bacterium]|nr:hypothetical protein [Bacteroidota bacterium]